MASFRDLLRQKDFWILLFFLGWVLLNWPLLSLTNDIILLDMPAILIYVSAVWLILILLMYLFDRGSSD
ncbi:MAG: hypothetical protein WA141_05165 [Methanothrix sp.]|uniref:hypothetical protein n=1 Tax=Methanothrix sp. TaxID=90426 RepID=UPI003BB57859